MLGSQVRALRNAPWDPQDSDDPWTRAACPSRRSPVGALPALLPARAARPARPVRARPPLRPPARPGEVGAQPAASGRPRPATRTSAPASRPGSSSPATDGHLDDFPYVEFVHRGATEPCGGPKLAMTRLGQHAGAAGDGALRGMRQGAATSRTRPAATAGRRCPPAGAATRTCSGSSRAASHLKLMVLGASNLWFSVTASALHLPQGQNVADVVAANWAVLGAQPDKRVVQLLVDRMPDRCARCGAPRSTRCGRPSRRSGPQVGPRPAGRSGPARRRVATAGPADHRPAGRRLPRGAHAPPRTATTTCSTRSSSSPGCGRCRPWSGSPGCPRPNAATWNRTSGVPLEQAPDRVGARRRAAGRGRVPPAPRGRAARLGGPRARTTRGSWPCARRTRGGASQPRAQGRPGVPGARVTCCCTR